MKLCFRAFCRGRGFVGPYVYHTGNAIDKRQCLCTVVIMFPFYRANMFHDITFSFLWLVFGSIPRPILFWTGPHACGLNGCFESPQRLINVRLHMLFPRLCNRDQRLYRYRNCPGNGIMYRNRLRDDFCFHPLICM